ncbi:MAG: shikimate dehydrogenase [Alphaproteobacteria bacterium]|nr:shikimate dehydrogenase [Alphaproteobacteria bacterium]
MRPTGAARLAGVFGWPISHSRSPQLHGYWLDHYGIDGAYVPLAVRPDDFPTVVRGMAKLGFVGANVTVPHKEAAFAACDTVDETARRIGAVNTLTFEGDRITGRNTDAYGFIQSVRANAPTWNADVPAVLLGAGGSARAVVVALLDAGVPEVRVLNRTAERAAELADAFGARVKPLPGDSFAAAATDAGLVVNCTTQGMVGQAALDIDLSPLPRAATVMDLIYTPLETPLLATAKARGHAVLNGLDMLLWQAKPGFAAWFGVDPEVTDALRQAVLRG